MTQTTQDAGVPQVRPVELFFDLVFVYAVSQLSGVLAHPHGLRDDLQAALVFLSLMWMYDGYVWLSSNARFETDVESWLYFAAMAGFFVMSLGIPDIRGAGGVLFGVGLLLVTAIHLLLFARVPTSSARAIAGIAPYNVASALLVLLAAVLPGAWHDAAWLAAIGVLVLATVTRREQAFALSPRHFAERHGLLIIIALGESVMGLGLGAAGRPLDAALLGYTVLGLLLVAHLWWGYFGPDRERSEHQFVSAGPARRNRMALIGYGYSHMLMMAGIILAAAGMEVGIHHPTGAAEGAAPWNLAIGLALFYAGHVLFRRAMDLPAGRLRALVAVACVASVPLGQHGTALWQLLACTAVVVAATLVEDYVWPVRHPDATTP